jgi:hypothetical protein
MNDWDQTLQNVAQEGTSAQSALSAHEQALFGGLRNRKKAAKQQADDADYSTLRYLFKIFH